jgi:hypothetical protein
MNNSYCNRRGQTWQNGDWRRLLASAADLSVQARTAFLRLRARNLAQRNEPRSLDCARAVAPFTGDGVPITGNVLIRPEYRSFP